MIFPGLTLCGGGDRLNSWKKKKTYDASLQGQQHCNCCALISRYLGAYNSRYLGAYKQGSKSVLAESEFPCQVLPAKRSLPIAVPPCRSAPSGGVLLML